MIIMGVGDPLSAQMLSITKTAVQKYAAAGEPIKEAAARTEVGRLLFQMGRGDDAFAELRQAAQIFEDHEADPPAAHALLGCAHALTIQNRLEESLPWFDRAIRKFREIGYEPGELEASAAKLEALGDLERWDAVDLSARIVARTEAAEDGQLRVLRLVALKYLAKALLAAGDPRGSLSPVMQAADIAHDVGDRGEEATLRLFVAEDLRLLQDFPRAVDQYKQVMGLARGLPNAADLMTAATAGLGKALRA
ncbi:hypothetical protein ACFU5O_28270 [Streptomyces sp. NPDC057445]|uniref:hypothetical protein n=1 Tax=Streptomyces sp. NPDC057445 TaxID=3346136 RepID=UPI0036BF4220